MLYGCTTFTIKTHSELIFGRNLDVESDIGTVFINPRGQKKRAYFSKRSKEIPAEWKSKFGSVTFNQISKDIPHGGINEKGLVVEHLYLEDSIYEKSDTRPALMSHQWIQYMLDTCGSVNDIIESCSRVRISDLDSKFPIHFNTMDRNGDSAIFEFLNGKMLIYKNEACEAGVLSNSTLESSIRQNESSQENVRNNRPTDVTNSLERFKKATELIEKYKEQNAIDYSFSVLDAVRNNTQWQIVYDIKNLKIYYRTQSQKAIRFLYLSECNFSDTNSKTIHINENPEVKANWLIFSQAINHEMINSICNKSEFINHILGNEKEEIASYSTTQ
ncbi:linear amide C-N hydrolase [Maribellus mangrovi]|uniref:linear amide C-N hydrolase n=1 Tax=Maribellus mangrovi TaxID=3133146 RepID=UPI0030ED9839